MFCLTAIPYTVEGRDDVCFYHLLKNYTHLKVNFFIIQYNVAQMLKPCPRSQHICFIMILNEKNKVRRQGFYFSFVRKQTLFKDFNLIFYFSLLSFLVLTNHCSKITMAVFLGSGL